RIMTERQPDEITTLAGGIEQHWYYDRRIVVTRLQEVPNPDIDAALYAFAESIHVNNVEWQASGGPYLALHDFTPIKVLPPMALSIVRRESAQTPKDIHGRIALLVQANSMGKFIVQTSKLLRLDAGNIDLAVRDFTDFDTAFAWLEEALHDFESH
ncbi:MAG: hypothetical protein AAF125_09840, partial [Chloroflexota bacterium]